MAALSGKQKRYLRAMGTGLEAIVQVGKGGLNDNVLRQLDEALEARELVKAKVLQNCEEETEQVASDLAQGTGADLVQVIGRTLLFYRPSKKKPQIQLP
ncbi:MAG: ribosome assembly RNA-binding protein YhbY [Syntrophomonadaceae bacterium]|jgi:RNA-binding protein|nr:ribosome assembly RNA-binding protein YhbY [Syntrophomonadaceae bacterium]